MSLVGVLQRWSRTCEAPRISDCISRPSLEPKWRSSVCLGTPALRESESSEVFSQLPSKNSSVAAAINASRVRSCALARSTCLYSRLLSPAIAMSVLERERWRHRRGDVAWDRDDRKRGGDHQRQALQRGQRRDGIDDGEVDHVRKRPIGQLLPVQPE